MPSRDGMRAKPPRPCLEHRCPEMALPGRSRCKDHDVNGTTPAWRKARIAALKRARYTCEDCGRTEAEAKRDGTWLEVHHINGEGVRAKRHDLATLVVLCRKPCHERTFTERSG